MRNLKEPQAEDAQKEFEKFVFQRFSGSFQVFSSAVQARNSSPPLPQKNHVSEVWDWQFSQRPREVKAYLDRFIMQQDEAKRALAIAICDHYNQVKAAYAGHPAAAEEYTKQNILLYGPTGVGKTYLIRKLSELIGVPFVKADATKFSETGYIGANVEDLVRELVTQAGGDLRKAECGLIYLDEADKLASRHAPQGKDVNGRGVQFGLLRIMEETEVDLRPSYDLQSQPQANMDFQRGNRSRSKINTKHILFILSGSFGGLENIIEQRLGRSTLGFQADHSRQPNGRLSKLEQTLQAAKSEDFISCGFEPEFISRMPIRVHCHPLSRHDLLQILLRSESSILRQYERSFQAFGIKLNFHAAALEYIAYKAAEEKTGARGLLTICEQALRPFKFELPSTSIRQLLVTVELVENPERHLTRLLVSHNATQDSFISN